MLKLFASLGSIAIASSVALVWAGGEQCKQTAASCGEKADKTTLVSADGSCAKSSAVSADGACLKAEKVTMVVSTGDAQCAEKAAAGTVAANQSCSEKTTLVSTGDAQCAEKAAGACAEKASLVSGDAQCAEKVAADSAKSSCCPETKGAMLVNHDGAKPMGALKALAGRWESKTGDGAGKASEFKVSSGGSAVVETMFPGQPHEMTNVYTMDGDRLLMTHYCAGGNQPRMQLVKQEGNTFTFEMIDATNLPDKNQPHMNGLELTINGDKIVEKWSSSAGGETAGYKTFELERAAKQASAR